MALLDFQTALGRLVSDRNGDALRGLHLAADESQCLSDLQQTDGFRFCVTIQRSWCIGRAAKSAYLTLSFLPERERQALLDEWIESGEGTNSFYDGEAASFLGFIRPRLVSPSHQLSICEFEQAILRAGEGRNSFTRPDAAFSANHVLRRGRYAGMVEFYGEPNEVLESLHKQRPLPPLADEPTTLLFGPGVGNLCYAASPEEIDLWNELGSEQAIGSLLSKSLEPKTIERMLSYGVIERVDPVDA